MTETLKTETKNDQAPAPQVELDDEELDTAAGGAGRASNVIDGTSNTILFGEVVR